MKKNQFVSRLELLLVLSVIALCAHSQTSREYIRERIKYYGSCKNVAITKTGGDLMLYADNGYAAKGCPSGLTNKLHQLNADGETIKDVQLTEDGRWLILYAGNAMSWYNVPSDLEKKMREFNEKQYTITSVTFNDNGDWIIISEEYISTSDSEYTDWLSDGIKEYGALWAACVTDDAIVAVFKGGYKFWGNVPDSLKDALKETELDVYRLKVAGGSWFFADKEGNYQYHM